MKNSMKKLRYRHSRGETLISFGPYDCRRFHQTLNGQFQKIIVVSDNKIMQLWGNQLNSWLNGYDFHDIIVEEGENAKDYEVINQVYNKLYDFKADRSSLIISLGGGSVSDTAAFVASTYMRGLPLLTIPTTLLAQADASIGGKTAYNFAKKKNLIGTFYQPQKILIDTRFLETLDERQITSGLAEVIKCCLLESPKSFNELIKHITMYKDSKDTSGLEKLILRSVRCKIKYVRKDEFEITDKRAFLNFGHTVGHAIEVIPDADITHGEAVALGMVAAARLGIKKYGLSETYLENLVKVLNIADLPISPEDYDVDTIIENIAHDKKIKHGEVRMLLPDKNGIIQFYDNISTDEIKEVIS